MNFAFTAFVGMETQHTQRHIRENSGLGKSKTPLVEPISLSLIVTCQPNPSRIAYTVNATAHSLGNMAPIDIIDHHSHCTENYKSSDKLEFVNATQNYNVVDTIEQIQQKNENFLEKSWTNLAENNDDEDLSIEDFHHALAGDFDDQNKFIRLYVSKRR